MNADLMALAIAIADKLVASGHLSASVRDEAIVLIAEPIRAVVYPETCPDCGYPLCPECSEHLEMPVVTPKNEFEGYYACGGCEIYVKPDKTTVPIVDFSLDSRFVYMDVTFSEGDPGRPTPEGGFTN
jgi:hypothetical protein